MYKRKLNLWQFLYYKIYIFFKFNLKHNIKLFASLTVIFGLVYLYFVEKHLKKHYADREVEMIESIALTIQNIESEMDKTLIAASIAVQERMLNNPKFSERDLILLANDLGITSIGILNGKDGKYEMSSSIKFDKNNKFYKELSLLDVQQCETQMCKGKLCRTEHEILNCKLKRLEVLEAIKNPSTPTLLPMMQVTLHSNNPVKAPAKWIVVYNKKLDKIIDIFYSKEEINGMIENNLKLHNHFLNFLKLTDNNGNLILESGIPMKDSVKIKLPFGKTWHFKVDEKDVSYSYILNAEFSTKELKYEIWGLRALFFLITSLLIALILIFKAKIKDNEKGIQMLKDTIRENYSKIKR